jgi:hypothetical protein
MDGIGESARRGVRGDLLPNRRYVEALDEREGVRHGIGRVSPEVKSRTSMRSGLNAHAVIRLRPSGEKAASRELEGTGRSAPSHGNEGSRILSLRKATKVYSSARFGDQLRVSSKKLPILARERPCVLG